MDEKKIVLTTAGSREEAQQIARALVERRLAACVSLVGPIESIYRWKEGVESAPEWLLIIKTTAAAFPGVRGAIGELHSYELPECLLIPIEDGSPAYLRWIAENVGGTGLKT
jgi:periplasmic divalent cation tolerance protein